LIDSRRNAENGTIGSSDGAAAAASDGGGNVAASQRRTVDTKHHLVAILYLGRAGVG